MFKDKELLNKVLAVFTIGSLAIFAIRTLIVNYFLGHFTAGKGPWKLVYQEKFETKTEALKKEKMLKRQNRKYIEWLIDSKK
jgi:putative endonuclease